MAVMTTCRGPNVVLVLAYFAALLGVTVACSETDGWKAAGITTRAGEVNSVILGNVTAKTEPRFNRRFGGAVYTATVSVDCVYKVAPQQTVYKEVEIVGFGETNDCINTEVELGQSYIFLIEPFQTKYAVVEKNVQVAAEPAAEENTSDMFSLFGCDEASEPTTPPPTTTLPTTLPPTTTEVPTTVPVTTEAMKTPETAKADKGETRDSPSPSGNGGIATGICGVLFAVTSAFSATFVF